MIDKRYLAGVIDTDGSLSITKRHISRKNPCYAGMLQLTWILNEDTLKFMDQLVEKYGGSYFIEKKVRKDRLGKKPIVKYCAMTKALISILKDIEPHLRLKKQQSKNIRNLAKIKNKSLPFKPRLPKFSKKMEELYGYNKELNGGTYVPQSK